MKLLVIASDKGGHFVPFIEEQIAALEARGVQIVRYGVTGKGITGYLRELPALRRLIHAERPDIIHAHYGLCGLLANLQRMVPVVTTYHGSDINEPNILRFSKIAMRLSAYNIFVSQRNVTLALSPNSLITYRLKKRYTLLPCGVNIPQPWSEMQTQRVEQLTLNQWVQGKLNAGVKHVLFAGAFNNAVKEPELSFLQLNRYIAFAKYHNLNTILCFNKNDLSSDDSMIEKVFKIYEPLGFDILFTSAVATYSISLSGAENSAFCKFNLYIDS